MPDTLDRSVTTEVDVLTPETERLVREIGIPPCPAVLEDFLAETRKEEPDLLRVSHLIGKDVALASAVMKTVNSPFFGLRTKARTVRDALTVLGLKSAARLLSGLLLRHAFPAANAAALESFWDMSAKTALVTAYLARELDIVGMDFGHSYGLFRDCGIPALLARFPEYTRIVGDPVRSAGRDIAEIERERFGVDHATVGATLARTWHVDDGIWIPIARHHDYPRFTDVPVSQPSAQLVALGLLADGAYRVFRRIENAGGWDVEEAFVEHMLGAERNRIEPLQNDIARILAAR